MQEFMRLKYLSAGLEKTGNYQFQTDLEFVGPFYLAKIILLWVRKITISDHLPY